MSGTERNSIDDGTGLTLNLVVEQESHEGGMEGEGAGTADSGSGETEGAGTVPSDPKIDCLVCKHCKAVISLADHLIEQRIEFLNSDVFSYDLDIFDREITTYSATNPHENRFDVFRLRFPDPAEHPKRLVQLTGSPTADHSWFPPYEWCFAHCWQCSSHIGWGFEAPDNASTPIEAEVAAAGASSGVAGVQSHPLRSQTTSDLRGGDGGNDGGGGSNDAHHHDNVPALPCAEHSDVTESSPQTHSAGTGGQVHSNGQSDALAHRDGVTAQISDDEESQEQTSQPGNAQQHGQDREEQPSRFLGLIVTKLLPDQITQEEYLESGRQASAVPLSWLLHAAELLAAEASQQDDGDVLSLSDDEEAPAEDLQSVGGSHEENGSGGDDDAHEGDQDVEPGDESTDNDTTLPEVH